MTVVVPASSFLSLSIANASQALQEKLINKEGIQRQLLMIETMMMNTFCVGYLIYLIFYI